ncbi:MAG: amidohydrolase family protein [Candidatus Bathyarchaeota archaeon]|nr:amidohydrolase family protein [Candidatus Bathyarchaeota archaeon]
MNIDFHNHFYPDAYVQELKREKGYASVSTDEQGRLLIHYTGDYNVVVGPHIDIEHRLKDMDKNQIDVQVLTLTTPGVERENKERGIKLAQLTNNGFREIIEKYPDRFTALATLPLQDPIAAVEELERSVTELGLKGAMLLSNVNGKPLDAPEYLPVYEKAVQLDVPMYIHPTSPINDRSMEDFRLVPMIGFGIDTSLAVIRLVLSGTMKKLPGLKLVASHVGGIFPFLRGRIETCFNAYPECKVHIKESPSKYLKKVWMDSIIYDNDVLMSALAFSGVEKMMLGTDHPHQIGDIEHAVQRIKDLPIPDHDKELILGGNAEKLLKL